MPKEKVTDIITFINEILEARQKGMEKSGGWFIRLKPVFDKIFGADWMEKNEQFWQDFKKKYTDRDIFPY